MATLVRCLLFPDRPDSRQTEDSLRIKDLPLSTGKMHADEADIDAALVGRLLAAQFPDWADLPIEPVRSAGTDNALYRLGDELVVRLPRDRKSVV